MRDLLPKNAGGCRPMVSEVQVPNSEEMIASRTKMNTLQADVGYMGFQNEKRKTSIDRDEFHQL